MSVALEPDSKTYASRQHEREAERIKAGQRSKAEDRVLE